MKKISNSGIVYVNLSEFFPEKYDSYRTYDSGSDTITQRIPLNSLDSKGKKWLKNLEDLWDRVSTAKLIFLTIDRIIDDVYASGEVSYMAVNQVIPVMRSTVATTVSGQHFKRYFTFAYPPLKCRAPATNKAKFTGYLASIPTGNVTGTYLNESNSIRMEFPSVSGVGTCVDIILRIN